jgi:hypothetical protein
VDLALLGGDRHHFRPAPGDRPDIGVLEALFGQSLAAGFVDLFDRPRDFKIEDARRFLQPLAVLGQLEDLTAIGAFALEDGARIMQAMRQHMQLGIAPGHESPVQPDMTGAIVERIDQHDSLPTGRLLTVKTGICGAERDWA